MGGIVCQYLVCLLCVGVLPIFPFARKALLGRDYPHAADAGPGALWIDALAQHSLQHVATYFNIHCYLYGGSCDVASRLEHVVALRLRKVVL